MCYSRFQGRSRNNDPFSAPPPEQVKHFNQTMDNNYGPSFDPQDLKRHPLQLDFTGTPASPWNKRCAILAAEAYVKLQNALSKDVEVVTKMTQTNFKALLRQWEIITDLPQSRRCKVIQNGIARTKYSRRSQVSHILSWFSFCSYLCLDCTPSCCWI
jgi:hypothetical protein